CGDTGDCRRIRVCEAGQRRPTNRWTRVPIDRQCGGRCFDSRRRVDSNVGRSPLEGHMRKLCYATTLCFVLLVSNAQAQEASNPPIKEPALRRELLKRVEQDQAIRNALISKGVKNP